MNPIEFLRKNGCNPDDYRTVPLQVDVACRDEYYNPKPVERVKVAMPGVKAVAAYMQSRGFENVSCRGMLHSPSAPHQVKELMTTSSRR